MAKGSRLAGVADGLVPRRRAGMPDVITCTSEGDDPSGRGRQGVNRPDDAPAGPAHGCELGATTRETHALAVAGNPCASRMIPLESPVPAIGTPGSESGGRKRAYGLRTAARPRKRRTSHRALPVTRLPSTLRSSIAVLPSYEVATLESRLGAFYAPRRRSRSAWPSVPTPATSSGWSSARGAGAERGGARARARRGRRGGPGRPQPAVRGGGPGPRDPRRRGRRCCSRWLSPRAGSRPAGDAGRADHGVPLERGHPRARAADRGTRVSGPERGGRRDVDAAGP